MSSKSRPRRSTRKDPWDENELLTSSKSKLIDLDLVRILANQEAWDCLEEDEKKQILNLLPEHTHPTADLSANGSDAKIPPLPQDFLRYSNNWRGGVRQFQVDLECGRYDPEWLSQADEAMMERADGKFDNWKDKEFEQFWGQKQKLHYASYAGEARQVKLETMVEHGVICKGDIWTYARVFDVGQKDKPSYARDFFVGEKGESDTILIEKEVKVVDIVGKSLTFAIPAGQRVIYPHHIELPEERLEAARKSIKPKSTGSTRRRAPKRKDPEPDASAIPERETRSSKRRSSAEQAGARKKQQLEQDDGNETSGVMVVDGVATEGEVAQNPTPEDTDNGTAPEAKSGSAGDGGIQSKEDMHKQAEGTLPVETNAQPDAQPETDETQNAGIKALIDGQANDTEAPTIKPEATEHKAEGQPHPNPESTKEQPEDELVILPNITTPSSLENHILAIDGRFKGVRNVNAWKALRCHRNNQDMGSLWEVRQAWYLKYIQ